jgi:hypothetical protein
MATVTFEPATDEDLQHVAGHMRADDVREFDTLGWAPLDAMRQSTRQADKAIAVRIDGTTVAVFGVRAIDNEAAVVWTNTTQERVRAPLTFFKAAKKAMRMLREYRPCLFNWVDSRKPQSIKWLKVLGFTIGEPTLRGGVPFCLCHIGDVSKYIH